MSNEIIDREAAFIQSKLVRKEIIGGCYLTSILFGCRLGRYSIPYKIVKGYLVRNEKTYAKHAWVIVGDKTFDIAISVLVILVPGYNTRGNRLSTEIPINAICTDRDEKDSDDIQYMWREIDDGRLSNLKKMKRSYYYQNMPINRKLMVSKIIEAPLLQIVNQS